MKYEAIKSQMMTGDLLLWRSNTLLGAAIRRFSRANVNHAGLVIRLQEYEGSEGRRFTTEALEHGIVLNLLSAQLKNHDGKVWWYPLRAEWQGKRRAIGERAFAWLGAPYDYPALFANAIKKVHADPERLFCSEYCFLCYGFTGEAPTPGDMPQLGIFSDPVLITP